jgi:hypothetical protein
MGYEALHIIRSAPSFFVLVSTQDMACAGRASYMFMPFVVIDDY